MLYVHRYITAFPNEDSKQWKIIMQTSKCCCEALVIIQELINDKWQPMLEECPCI